MIYFIKYFLNNCSHDYLHKHKLQNKKEKLELLVSLYMIFLGLYLHFRYIWLPIINDPVEDVDSCENLWKANSTVNSVSSLPSFIPKSAS